MNYGKNYLFEHIPPKEVHDISATKIREKLKNK